jgi:Kef-type K+ transport system membrane component KefB
MAIFIVALVAWPFLGWKIGAALAVGVCLEFIEAALLYRGLLKLRRENADLVKLANGQRSVDDVTLAASLEQKLKDL